MKNLYTAFACAVAVSASAIAAVPAAEKATLGSFNAMQSLAETSVMSKSIKKAPMKVAMATEDVAGFYAVEYIYPFTEGEATKTTATIEMVDETQIIITLEPWCNGYSNVKMDGILADYDPATGAITMKCEDNADLGTFITNMDQPGEKTYSLNLSAQQLVPIPDDPEGKGEWKQIDVVNGVVNEDGTITFGDDDTMWGFGVIGEPGSYVGAFRGAKFVAPDYFSFVESEWNSLGKATFTDNWLNNLLTDPADEQYKMGPQEVDLFNNKANPAMFCVKNPYAACAMNEDPEATGYIVFDMSYPELIPMRTLTESGLWITIEEGGFPEAIMLFNREGAQYYDNETPIADLIELFEQNKIVASSFDKATNTVTLKNLFFAIGSAPAGAYSWNQDADGNWNIKIQANAFAGVENVFDDAADVENAPVRYYNLQGMEVAAPEAGQLVIKKQGSKTTKLIVR